MLNLPVPRHVFLMAFPTIAGQMITSLYNLADTYSVSQLGTDATGADELNGTIDHFIMMAGSLFAMGGASYTSRLLGARKDQHARENLSICFFFALLLGAAVLVPDLPSKGLCLCFWEPIRRCSFTQNSIADLF